LSQKEHNIQYGRNENADHYANDLDNNANDLRRAGHNTRRRKPKVTARAVVATLASAAALGTAMGTAMGQGAKQTRATSTALNHRVSEIAPSSGLFGLFGSSSNDSGSSSSHALVSVPEMNEAEEVFHTPMTLDEAEEVATAVATAPPNVTAVAVAVGEGGTRVVGDVVEGPGGRMALVLNASNASNASASPVAVRGPVFQEQSSTDQEQPTSPLRGSPSSESEEGAAGAGAAAGAAAAGAGAAAAGAGAAATGAGGVLGIAASLFNAAGQIFSTTGQAATASIYVSGAILIALIGLCAAAFASNPYVGSLITALVVAGVYATYIYSKKTYDRFIGPFAKWFGGSSPSKKHSKSKPRTVKKDKTTRRNRK
jgi:hypothetical protein